ncbi:TetR/AcrR family transcriptional repressor of lmrAB and yxaGH operons [Neobacillus niacini]|uniref:TetR/AcrR family transcriptional regulator n=1 Tax=Neobacillus niacini TaxID=86668 RepID=UPI0028649F46|nr:TetR/AcrR family transcriptional regulator [Neobacillus niacini]MDR7079245.1 TetR/AcrR family transcriptional repressor of lmrAB and yxaGH operons [Neobacillus niacini]
MDTKSLIIEIATTLFQKKGYIGVGLSEILKACNISKGSLYHHFPNGKEELLIACLQTLEETITKDIDQIFKRYQTTKEATKGMIEKLIVNFETEGTITGYTFSSIVSEMASLSNPVRNACAHLYQKIQGIYLNKLLADGFSKETASSIAVMMTATIEGGMMLCLTQKTSEPLKIISERLPNLIN